MLGVCIQESSRCTHGIRSRLLGVVIDHMLADSSSECGVMGTAMVIMQVWHEESALRSLAGIPRVL